MSTQRICFSFLENFQFGLVRRSARGNLTGTPDTACCIVLLVIDLLAGTEIRPSANRTIYAIFGEDLGRLRA